MKWNRHTCGVAAGALLAGCSGNAVVGPAAPPAAAVKSVTPEADDVATERGKLTAAERAAVDAQEWCVVNQDGRLGSMGAPIKLTIKGETVYLCCAGCKRKAEADPEKTLAALAALKAKAKAKAAPKG